MQHKLLQSYVIKRSQPKKAAYEVKPLAMQCNFNQGGTPLWLCFYNVEILPMVGISRNYCSTIAQKLNSSTIAQLWHVCPTIGNILLAAVNFAL
jgi:hypothetical protein